MRRRFSPAHPVLCSLQIRGALNAVRSLVEQSERAGRALPRALVTHSSGNHGQALACAAQAEGNLHPALQHSPQSVNAELVLLGRMERSLLNPCRSWCRQGSGCSCSSAWLL